MVCPFSGTIIDKVGWLLSSDIFSNMIYGHSGFSIVINSWTKF